MNRYKTKNMFINPLEDFWEKDYNFQCKELYNWIRGRLDLCGGWLPEIDKSYNPKICGTFSFSRRKSKEIQKMACRLGKLYARVAKQAGKYFYDNLNAIWPFDNFSPVEYEVLRRVGHPNSWVPMLRPDIIIDKSGNPKIIEINVDNPAGFEETILFLKFFQKNLSRRSKYNVQISIVLSRLYKTLSWWLNSQYKHFLDQLPLKRGSQFSVNPQIAVVFEDRNDSFFLSRYLTAFLNEMGYKALACRPEHLFLARNRLWVESPALGQPVKVDLVIRDWLFYEMFEEEPDGRKVFKSKFETFLKAIEQKVVLVLNPVSDRLFFSKAILAELHKGEGGFFSLSSDDSDFVRRYIAKTWILEDRPSESQLSNRVFKPSNLCSGLNVIVGRRLSNPASFPKIDFQKEIWIAQEEIIENKHKVLYRHSESKVSSEEVFSTHGLLIYNISDDEYGLAGAMTKMSLNPVVSFTRGAQLIPTLL